MSWKIVTTVCLTIALRNSLAVPAPLAVWLNPYRTVDLTHPQDENALGYPLFKPFERKITIKEENFGGVEGQYVEGAEFNQHEHLGTHMDAPLHFQKNGQTIDEIPLTNLMGPGIVLDVRHKSNNGDDNYVITKEDFIGWEEVHGRMPNKAIVFILTGKGAVYSNATHYYGWKTKEDAENRSVTGMHFPGLSKEAAKFLVYDRGVVGTGIDAMSIDPGYSATDFPAHRVLLPNNVWIIENVGSKLSTLPPKGFYVLALPYKIKSGTGAPTRTVAVLGYQPEDEPKTWAGTNTVKASFVFTVMALIINALNV